MTNSTAKKLVQVGQIVRNRYSQAIAKVIAIEKRFADNTGDYGLTYLVRRIGGECLYWGSEITSEVSASDEKFYARYGEFRGN